MISCQIGTLSPPKVITTAHARAIAPCTRPFSSAASGSKGRRREDGEISVTARERTEADLAVSYRRKLAAQKTWWGTVFRRRPIGINNTDVCARLECRDEIVKKAVGLSDLVIHGAPGSQCRASQLAISGRAAHQEQL
jgi:hypothetical protein